MQFVDNILTSCIYSYSLTMKRSLKYQNKVIKSIFSGLVWLVPSLDFFIILDIQNRKVRNSTVREAIVYFLLEVALLLVTSLHSPGYCVDMEGDVDVEKASLLNKDGGSSSKRGSICKECGIKRPLRSCHCTECDRCIVRFDHHDVVVNNCIGYGNQQYYLFFLISGFGLPLLFIYNSFTGQQNQHSFISSIYHFIIWIVCIIKLLYHFTQLRRLIPNVLENLTEYESINAYKIGYLKDDNFRFFNPFNHGTIRNCMEFFHLSIDWMRTHYYCLMDIPDHPLRVKGLAYLQQKSEKSKMDICTCPKCGTQLYRPKDVDSMKCTCGYVFPIKDGSSCSVCL